MSVATHSYVEMGIPHKQ